MLREHTNERAFVQISSAVLLALLVLVAVRGLAIPGADCWCCWSSSRG